MLLPRKNFAEFCPQNRVRSIHAVVSYLRHQPLIEFAGSRWDFGNRRIGKKGYPAIGVFSRYDIGNFIDQRYVAWGGIHYPGIIDTVAVDFPAVGASAVAPGIVDADGNSFFPGIGSRKLYISVFVIIAFFQLGNNIFCQNFRQPRSSKTGLPEGGLPRLGNYAFAVEFRIELRMG